MEMNLRKIVQLFCYYLIPLYLLLMVLFNLYFDGDLYDNVVELGEVAFILVSLILFVKPLSVLLPQLRIIGRFLGYRRELGVLAFWYAMFHSISLIFYLNLATFQGMISLLSFETLFYSFGFFAMIGMIVLGFTSNRLAVMKLKGKWKKVQMIVFTTYAFICVHMAMAEDEFTPYVILGFYVLLKIAQYFKQKK